VTGFCQNQTYYHNVKHTIIMSNILP